MRGGGGRERDTSIGQQQTQGNVRQEYKTGPSQNNGTWDSTVYCPGPTDLKYWTQKIYWKESSPMKNGKVLVDRTK